MNGKEVDGKLEEFGQNIVVSKLTVPQLRREHRNTTYKCRAANTHLIPPLEKTVILDVYRECLFPSRIARIFANAETTFVRFSSLRCGAMAPLAFGAREEKKKEKDRKIEEKMCTLYLEFSLMKILKI